MSQPRFSKSIRFARAMALVSTTLPIPVAAITFAACSSDDDAPKPVETSVGMPTAEPSPGTRPAPEVDAGIGTPVDAGDPDAGDAGDAGDSGHT